MRPIIRALEQRGAEVLVTARDFAQTLEPVRAARARATRRSATTAAAGWPPRASACCRARRRSLRWARGRRIDVALGHGSNDVTVAARLLGIPSSTTFDYEWAKVQHNVNCRLRAGDRRPGRDPARAAAPLRRRPRPSYRRYAGLKEEYYLADFEPDPAVLGELGLDPARSRSRSSARRRRSRSTTASRTRCSRRCSTGSRPMPDRRAPAHARAARRARRLHRPRARDRRPVADRLRRPRGLGRRDDEPRGGRARDARCWTTFEGRLGAVDEALIADGPAAPAGRAPRTSSWPSAPPPGGERTRRDPAVLADLLLSPIGGLAATGRARQ